MARIKLSGGEDERALPKVGRKWGRLLFYKSRYGWVVRTVSDQVSPAQRRVISGWSEWLRWMNILWKYLAPDIKLEFLRLEKISGVPARDLFSSSMNGLLWYFELEDGRRVYSMAHVERISRSLDVFSQTKGSLLVRGDEVWEAIAPGSEGYVLRMVGGRPVWAPGGDGGGKIYHFPAGILDGGFGWRGRDGFGVTAVCLHDNQRHYVRCAVPGPANTSRISVEFLAVSGLNPVGRVVFWVSVYKRVDASYPMIGRTELVVDFTGSGYPARIISANVDLEPDNHDRLFIVEVTRVGDHPLDDSGREVCLYYVSVWF